MTEKLYVSSDVKRDIDSGKANLIMGKIRAIMPEFEIVEDRRLPTKMFCAVPHSKMAKVLSKVLRKDLN